MAEKKHFLRLPAPNSVGLIRAIRSGLVMIIPVLMVGSFALILKSFPLRVYLDFIHRFAGGFLEIVFNLIYKATFGMLSVYMAVSVSYSMAKDARRPAKNLFGAPICALALFMIFIGFGTESFSANNLGPVGMFPAIVSSTLSSQLYLFISARFDGGNIFSDGSDPGFNRAIFSIIPIGLTLVVFTGIHYGICRLFDVPCFWALVEKAFTLLFGHVGENFFGGLLYILSSSILWFFGIHGSDVLESVNQSIFIPAAEANAAAIAAGLEPTEIFTKTFFDVFVLIGGCGTLLSLLLALLIFSRRKSNRSLAKIAAFPMLFNINEIMVFGLPIIYNPIMLIPFILAPLASFLISSGTMALGLVPLTTVAVEWTTPVLLGGYQSTGAVSGAILQLVNLAAGTLIYMPFVLRYDKRKEEEAKENMNALVGILREHEESTVPVTLTELEGNPGEIAKLLVNDLRHALEKDELFLLYQPQYDDQRSLIGAEALLRWRHPVFGMIYPPLIIKLAEEDGRLTELEKKVYLRAKADMEKSGLDFKISINITAQSVQDADFIDFLVKTFPDGRAGKARVFLEITEQSELVTNEKLAGLLARLRRHGFGLAIDDFSMGHTSLKYLQESQFDLIKLDGSLIRALKNDTGAKEIIASIVYLSQSLNFSVLAEFVETEEQKELLEELGCTKFQGYLFSPAVEFDRIAGSIRKNSEKNSEIV